MGVGQASEPWEDKIMAVAAKAWPTVRAPETFLEQVRELWLWVLALEGTVTEGGQAEGAAPLAAAAAARPSPGSEKVCTRGRRWLPPPLR